MKDLDLLLHDLLNSVHGLRLYFENPSSNLADIAKNELRLMEQLIKNEQSKNISVKYAIELMQSFLEEFSKVEVSFYCELQVQDKLTISAHQYYRILKNVLINVQEARATYLDVVVDQRDGQFNINFLNDFISTRKESSRLSLKSCKKQAEKAGGMFSFGRSDILAWSKLTLQIDQIQKKVA